MNPFQLPNDVVYCAVNSGAVLAPELPEDNPAQTTQHEEKELVLLILCDDGVDLLS